MRAAVQTFAAVLVLGAAGPSFAHEDLPRWAAGCQMVATAYHGQTAPGSDAHKASGEAAAFWQGALLRAEPDEAKRAAQVADLKKALDADLVGKSPAEHMNILSTALAACAPLRRVAEQETGEVKP